MRETTTTVTRGAHTEGSPTWKHQSFHVVRIARPSELKQSAKNTPYFVDTEAAEAIEQDTEINL